MDGNKTSDVHLLAPSARGQRLTGRQAGWNGFYIRRNSAARVTKKRINLILEPVTLVSNCVT